MFEYGGKDVSLQLVDYSNAFWSSCKEIHCSMDRFAFILGDLIVVWSRKKQSANPLLSTKIKYAIVIVAKNNIWLQNVLRNHRIQKVFIKTSSTRFK